MTLVKCSSCGKLIERKRVRYGKWTAKCRTCQNEKKRKRNKHVYGLDFDLREKKTNEANVRYQNIKQLITPREIMLLTFLHSYPVLTPSSLGTLRGDYLDIIEIDGKERVRGAIFLEEWKNTPKQDRKRVY